MSTDAYWLQFSTSFAVLGEHQYIYDEDRYFLAIAQEIDLINPSAILIDSFGDFYEYNAGGGWLNDIFIRGSSIAQVLQEQVIRKLGVQKVREIYEQAQALLDENRERYTQDGFQVCQLDRQGIG